MEWDSTGAVERAGVELPPMGRVLPSGLKNELLEVQSGGRELLSDELDEGRLLLSDDEFDEEDSELLSEELPEELLSEELLDELSEDELLELELDEELELLLGEGSTT